MVIGVGSVVSGYRVERVLGSGGMGTVYAVADPVLPRLDALKVMPSEFSADADFRKRFMREADIAARLDHPNIVSVYDRGETPEGQLWIAMQLVDGTDADEALRAGLMTPARAVHIIAGIGEALDYAHRQYVLHRDIKPANFMLTGPPGRDERVLLGDFGIARSADDAGMTATNAVMTTMAYAAPELLEGRAIDYRADLYSLGCSLYQLLTGQTPFADAGNMAAQAMAHLRRPPPQPSLLVPGLPIGFDAVIAKAMAKDPAQRYPSGRALAEAAAAALRQPMQNGVPDGGVGRANTGDWSVGPKRTSARGKLIAAAVAGVVVIAGGVTAVTLTGNSAPKPTPTTPQNTSAAPTVAAADLAGLMLPAEDISSVVGMPVKSVKTLNDFSSELAYSDDAGCVALIYPIQESTYSNSGGFAAYGEVLNPDGAKGEATAIQSVVSFTSPDLARQFVDRQTALLQTCASKSVLVSGGLGKPEVSWLVDSVDSAGGVLSARSTKEGQLACQRALTAASTLTVDVRVCLETGLANQGVELAKKLAAKVTAG